MRYLVDTDWLIDALVGLPEAVATLEDLTSSGLGISIVSVGEIYEGATAAPTRRQGVLTIVGFSPRSQCSH